MSLSDTTTLAEAAEQYAVHGWAVFPLAPGTKVPLIKGGRGCLDATVDIEQIRAWWSAQPDANIGIATGKESGVVVIDHDTYKQLGDLAPALRALLDDTPHQMSPRGGDHWFVKDREGRKLKALGAGIDIKADGGYVAAWPSVGPQGRYEWEASGEPWDLDPVTLPDEYYRDDWRQPERAPRAFHRGEVEHVDAGG